MSLDLALGQLRAAVDDVPLTLPLPGAENAAQAAARMRNQLDDYVLPRLATLNAPLLVVVGGSTGAGKSTLVNSLVGRRVTTPGVIRPTTRSPVLVHHPDDEHWFSEDRILPGLSRTATEAHDASTLRLVPEPTLPPGIALLDTPDVDSVVAQNRALATQMLAAADLWLFVTSAARYADAVPWEFLRDAAARSAVVAVVLDRVPPAGMSELPAHLGQLMSERGLADSPLFAVPETTTDEDGLLPDAAVSPLRGWLASLAADRSAREAVIRRTLDGAIGALVEAAVPLARNVDDQVHTAVQLRDEAEASYAEAVRTIAVQSADGTLLRGEVLARWHEFVGTGEVLRVVEEKISWLRDRIGSWIRGRPPGTDDLEVAVESGLEALIRDEGEAAAERVERSWHAHVAGRQVLDRSPVDLGRASPDYGEKVAATIRDWQRSVLELVAGEGMKRRSRARFAALGVNAVGLALMIFIFSQTGGLVGAEVGVAGGTALLAQRLLEAIFGDDAVRRLAKTAKQDLDDRVQALLAGELVRYSERLAELGLDAGAGDRIRAAAEEVARAREAGTLAVAADRPDELPAGESVARITTGERLALPGIEAAGPQVPSVLEGELLPAEQHEHQVHEQWDAQEWREQQWQEPQPHEQRPHEQPRHEPGDR